MGSLQGQGWLAGAGVGRQVIKAGRGQSRLLGVKVPVGSKHPESADLDLLQSTPSVAGLMRGDAKMQMD